jgi:hypothetical protein
VHCLLICVLAIVASCYRPRIEGACEVQCTAAAPACPSGLSCGADGLCFDDIECSLIDAGIDDTPRDDTPPSGVCAGAGWLANTCPLVIGPALALPSMIDTQTDCTEVLGGHCMIAAEAIAVVGSVVVTGPRPLVLFAQTNINVAVSSVIDAASGSGIGCPTIATGASTTEAANATGGGPGGTLGGRGGSGGGAFAKVRAMSPVAFAVTSFRGGCPGGSGGVGPSTAPAPGGTGGGGIYLIAGQTITIVGTIRAAGGGGGGATPQVGVSAGGGGGGSGGMIALDAPTIRVSGVLFAQGGGGGGGGRGGNGGSGSAALVIGNRAPGGPPAGPVSTSGGQGAGLGVMTGDNAADSLDSGGAGGGGGGAGIIKLFGAGVPMIDGVVSPPAT